MKTESFTPGKTMSGLALRGGVAERLFMNAADQTHEQRASRPIFRASIVIPAVASMTLPNNLPRRRLELLQRSFAKVF
ncbi:MAG: hypothetical protein JSR77_04800 [Planctomycetes bacterium]|nr:hypothetical protein [Planctomycetota bacterium]